MSRRDDTPNFETFSLEDDDSLFAAGPDDDPPLTVPKPRPASSPASSGGLIGRFKDGMALARGHKPAAPSDRVAAPKADNNGGLLGRFKSGVALARGEQPRPPADDDAPDDTPAADSSPLFTITDDEPISSFSDPDAPDSPAPGGLLGKLRAGVQLAQREQAAQAPAPAASGVDLSAPRGRRRISAPDPAPTLGDDDLGRLLTPLASSEIRALQEEMRHEDAYVQVLDRAEAAGERHGLIGGLVAIVSLLMLIFTVALRNTDSFVSAVTDGIPDYFTDTVNKATLPNAIADWLTDLSSSVFNADVQQGIAVISCFLLAFAAAGVAASAATAVMQAVTMRSLIQLVRGFVGSVAAYKMFVALATFKPVTAAAFGAGWLIFDFGMRALRRAGGR